MKYHYWTDASALWQLEHGTEGIKLDTAREYLERRLAGESAEDIGPVETGEEDESE